MQQPSASNPIVYSDSRQRKIFIMPQMKGHLLDPAELQLFDKEGKSIAVPCSARGDMMVMDVSGIGGGSYFLRLARDMMNSIKVVLF